MYLDHFGLHANPFGLSPKLDFLFRSEAFEESMAHLVYGVDNGEPLVMITGPIGTGKTMAIQSFLSHLGDHFETALVTNTRVDGRELLKLILDDLGLTLLPGTDKSDLLIAFKGHLLANSAAGRRVLIVVDEAQNLAADALEEVRLLTNLGQGDDQPVQIVLVGQPELEAVVNLPGLAQLRQRIRVHYRLEPLSRDEIDGYVRHRMSVAGGADVFSADALDRIYEYSGGVPRLVNTYANDGLLAAYVAGKDRVRGEHIEPRMRTPAVEDAEVDGFLDAVLKPTHHPVAAAPRPPAATYARPRRGRGRRVLLWLLSVLVFAAAATAAGLYFLPGLLAPERDAVPLGRGTTALPTADTATVVVVVPGASTADSDALSALPDTSTAPPAESPTGTEVSAVAVKDWCVHIGSFRTEDRALAYAGDLKQHAPDAFYRFDTVRGVGWYRVFAGPYADRPTALAEAHRLQSELHVSYYKIVRIGADGEPDPRR